MAQEERGNLDSIHVMDVDESSAYTHQCHDKKITAIIGKTRKSLIVKNFAKDRYGLKPI